MILSNLRRCCSYRTATPCAFIMLVVLLVVMNTGRAIGQPKTVAEIALYQGADREKILIEGAKKEGQLTLYTMNTWTNDVVAKAFEKKYPFIKVSSWRSQSMELLKRITEEYTAGRFFLDVVETTPPTIQVLHKEGILQEYRSQELAYYGDDVKEKGKNGVYYCANREIYISLGFNTKLIPPAEAPKSYKDLLDSRWKGKMSIAGSSTGVWWIGNAIEVMGRDFIEKLSYQDVKVQNISGAALAGLIVSGEVPLSPTIFDSNIFTAKQKGAPVEWRPIEPVIANVAYSGVMTKAPHPNAALLFIDYFYSKEGQKVMMQGGLSSPREDIGLLEQKFKKSYLESRFQTLDEYEKKYEEWQNLLMQLFIKKR